MSEEVKQEGEFKMKTPSKPKNLGKANEVTKVEIPNTAKEAQGEVIPEVTKVEIKKEQDDAVQTQETNDSDVVVEEPKDSGDSEGVVEEVRTTEETVESPLTVVEETEEEAKQVAQEQSQQTVLEQKQLPENIEKLVSFMEETGGNVEDYVRLNADYSNVDNNTLLKEYYKQTRPHLDNDEVSFLIEDAFSWDEDIDDERDIKKKKLAFKEEVAKAKEHLEDLKGKYYEEIKLRPGTTQEQQKATEFFNRYNEEQSIAQQQHESFKNNTKELFNNDFKGFDFEVGEKKFRYNIQNTNQVAENQSNINNLIKKFLNDKGDVVDTKGYHKAMYAAENADKIANHFYEQGKADAVREVVNSSKNIDATPRQSPGDVYIQGLKVRAISGADSSKLKVKTKKFNN